MVKGWDAGKSTMAILLDEEQASIDNNDEDDRGYEERKALLKGFAGGICAWSSNL